MSSDPLDLAGKLADAAAQAIKPHFRSHLAIEDKADQSPVTIADRDAETAMRAILAREAPEDGIFGEEFGIDNPDAKRLWVLDPLDGTRAFASGFPIFGTLIALMEDKKPIFGLCHMPVTTERVWGDGQQSVGPHGPLNTSAQQSFAKARLRLTSHQMFDVAEFAAVEALSAAAGLTHMGGDCYNYFLLAGGHIELVVEADLQPYDYAALIPIVEGAGGIISDWRGQPLTLDSSGQVLASANAALHEAALSYLTPYSKD